MQAAVEMLRSCNYLGLRGRVRGSAGKARTDEVVIGAVGECDVVTGGLATRATEASGPRNAWHRERGRSVSFAHLYLSDELGVCRTRRAELLHDREPFRGTASRRGEPLAYRTDKAKVFQPSRLRSSLCRRQFLVVGPASRVDAEHAATLWSEARKLTGGEDPTKDGP